MALPERFQPIYQETQDTVRARLLKAVPENYAVVEGSWARDMLEISVLELSRMWSELNNYLSYTFIQYAYGPLLDGMGQQYGTPRKPGTPATGTVRFTAPPGTVIARSTLVGVPSVDP